MSRLIISTTKSPRIWMTVVFFALPLISTALFESNAATADLASSRPAGAETIDGPWTPIPMDATTDGTIIVRKVAYPRSTSQTFTFSGDVSGTIPNGGLLTVTGVPAPGSYTSTEAVPGGWQLESIQCDDGTHHWGNTATFDVGLAETIQCTFYNVENGTEPCLELTGRWPYGPSHAVDVDTTTVFMGSGAALVSVDASAPSNPLELDAVDLDQVVRGVDVSGNQVFVTTSVGYDGSLVIVDATNPADLQHVGDVYIAEPNGLEVAGSYAYIASGGWDLTIVDVIDPSNPTVTGLLSLPGIALDVSLSGNLAVVATGYDGVRIVDVTSPLAPFEVGSIELGQYARAVDVVGLYAYVANDSDGLTIINIADPAHPLVAGSYATMGALGVQVEGTLAYVSDSWWGLKVIDVSNPTSPSPVGGLSSVGRSEQVVVVGEYAYLSANRSDLQIVDISLPSAPVATGALTYPDEAYDADLIGDFAYLSLGYEGDILVLDVSDPTSPSEAALFSTIGAAEALQPVGSYAFQAAGPDGLRVLDVSDPAAPSDIGGVDTPGWGTDVAVLGDYAYLADSNGGLRVMDVSTPSSPFEAGSVSTPGSAIDVVTDGAHAYVAIYSAGIHVYSVNLPGAPPQHVGSINPTGSERALAMRGSHVFVAGTSGLRVIDVSNPAAPEEVGFYDDYVNATDIVLQGQFAHITAGYEGIVTYDVSDPTAPILVDRIPLASNPTAVAAGRSRLLITQDEVEFEMVTPCGLLMADDFETGDLQYWASSTE